MIRQHIVHQTVYRYREPVTFGMHRLVLRPREGHSVTVVRHQLSIVPHARLFWLTDLFGNNVALAEITEPADRLEITNEVIIERVTRGEDAAPTRKSRPSVSPLPVAYPQMELPVVRGYMAAVYPEDVGLVQGWVAPMVKPDGAGTALEAVENVGRAIHQHIRYRRREEPGVQRPGTTLTLGTGSCRDMAVLMIESCRALGIAARFVSGYLDSAASAAGRGATHAWADVYLPDSGWVGYDPTLGELVSRKHIALGVSAHPRGVMPISGIYSGPAGSYEGMQVVVSVQEIKPDKAHASAPAADPRAHP